MKKVIALLLALVLVLSLAACGSSEKSGMSDEEIKKEKIKVDGLLQGSWSLEKETEGVPYVYVLLFDNGKVYFASKSAISSYSDEETYEIYPESKEVICTVTKGNKLSNGLQRTLTYEFESSGFKLYFEGEEYTKII